MPDTPTPGQIFAVLVVLGLMLASVVMIIRTVVQAAGGKVLVPFERRSRPQFGVWEILTAIVAYVTLGIGSMYLVRDLIGIAPGTELTSMSPDQFLAMMILNSALTAMPCLLLLAMLPLRHGGKLADYGLSLGRVPHDIGLGIGAFLLMAGTTYLMQSILFQLFPQQHPLLEMIQANPEPKYFLGALISASIMAPIFEEFFFRGTIQGWLEKFFLYDNDELTADAVPEAAAADEIIDALPVSSTAAFTIDAANPYVSPTSVIEPEAERQPQRATGNLMGWVPIVISSLLFSLMHLGQGPAPIPLFFLALCLGYMYQKTHRLLPCIVMHMLLNTTSIVMLWLSVVA